MHSIVKYTRIEGTQKVTREKLVLEKMLNTKVFRIKKTALRKKCYWIKSISFQKHVYHGFKSICLRISNIFIGSCSIFLWINSIHDFWKKCFWFNSIFFSVYSLHLNQSKSTDYQWNLTDSNSLKEVTVNQSNFTDYFNENWLIWQWKIFYSLMNHWKLTDLIVKNIFHWWISEKENH